MPFILLGFLPLMIMSFMIHEVKTVNETPGAFVLFYISVLCLAVKTVMAVDMEIDEIRNQ